MRLDNRRIRLSAVGMQDAAAGLYPPEDSTVDKFLVVEWRWPRFRWQELGRQELDVDPTSAALANADDADVIEEILTPFLEQCFRVVLFESSVLGRNVEAAETVFVHFAIARKLSSQVLLLRNEHFDVTQFCHNPPNRSYTAFASAAT